MTKDDYADQLRDVVTEAVNRFKATLPELVTVSIEEDDVSDTEHSFDVFLTDERDD